MTRLVLASALSQWIPEAAAGGGEIAMQVAADSVGEALEAAFLRYPALRGYVLDEQGIVRHHVAVFVDGVAIRDKTLRQIAIADDAEVYVMQALSGG
jgi:sulfur-carrier protein